MNSLVWTGTVDVNTPSAAVSANQLTDAIYTLKAKLDIANEKIAELEKDD